MGNVNGREEDGANSPSGSSGGGVGVGVDEEGGGGKNGSEGMVAPDEAHLGYLPPPPELMGQSPPHSPRATQSPLMFTPQVSFSLFFCFFFLFFLSPLVVMILLWVSIIDLTYMQGNGDFYCARTFTLLPLQRIWRIWLLVLFWGFFEGTPFCLHIC